ncbi:tRNA-guanine(15) transglycosylase-like protein [Gamsiella multidivaricata]|uniref:tRNA-guanine(15) transglycosylase-like protein n=1 Tax=Gamsiella multidivaricata TaxID=101098 RepID=UPI0022208792|nr:tRNA-guanine(15) transglycosylase-like protein [Gamsiella multidivaricata]KAG0355969.1 Queuine tRNA-ribosyltransferase subunit qtrtd1 [Gamsiella multidivaricata]KAI7818445.1 tRNA-guanine(15) transglycosylase-like protein [Gamsiella multidivaricata]
MSPLTFNIIRQSTQLSAARRGTVAMTQAPAAPSTITSDMDKDLSGTAVATKRVIETPGCFMYTVKGSVPHLTPDTLRLQRYGGVNVSIEQIMQDHQPSGFDKWPFTLSKYLHLQDFILMCDIRDSSRYTKVPYNSNRYVSMLTQQGVRQLTLEDYFKVVRAYEPDIVAAFADTISDLDQTETGKLIGTETGSKRVKKSVDRSLKWLDQILRERQGYDALAEERAMEEAKKKLRKEKMEGQSQAGDGYGTVNQIVQETKHLTLDSLGIEGKKTGTPWTGVSVFAHVVGAQMEQERIRSAQETAKRSDVDGFIIDTLALPGSRDDVLKLLKASIDQLPTEKPRIVYGMQAPEDVLRAIALGADLFDTSYPLQLTEDGKASLYSFGAPSAATPNENGSSGTNATVKRWINLWDDEHADKFVPLLEGCDCYACKGGRHTRAYINHLLKAHEMLATVLLMSHNMHQYSKFFSNVRQSIQDGTFEQLSTTFVETFGAEPERTGEIHAAQAAVEAALSKRNRLDGNVSNDGGAAGIAAKLAVEEERKQKKDQMKEARRARKKEEGMKRMVNKKEMRMEKKMREEQQLEDQQEQGQGLVQQGQDIPEEKSEKS